MNDDPLWLLRTAILMLCFIIIILSIISTGITILTP